MEKRVYGDNYKCVLDKNNEVIWGYGQIPFDFYKPHENLKYYQRGRDHWFSITTDFYPIDWDEHRRCKENSLLVRGKKWILDAYFAHFIF